MIYLYWYLGIGIVLLFAIFISKQIAQPNEFDEIAALVQATDPRRNNWWWKPLDSVILPIVASMVFVVVWPIGIALKVKDMVYVHRSRSPKIETPPKEFAVSRASLQKRWTVAEIEAAEVVVDPMGAAPRSPFGHLNPAWETFKESILDDDQLWSFSAPWTPEWGANEIREGYVVLRGEAIGPHFLTRWVVLDKETG